MKTIVEGSAIIKIAEQEKVSKKLPVFYNPIMKTNRDISILLLNALNKKQMQIALPLAGSGVRGIRFLKELKKDKIKNISFNDLKPITVKYINKNILLNNIKNKKLKPDRKGNIDDYIKITNKEADIFLLESSGFDYIDIDPFGTPNPFLDASIKRLARKGILAITATDTSALAGTYENACKRKYWAKPLRTAIMHEIGLRILIRKIQLIAAQYEKALTPIFSYATDHYYRVYFQCQKGKTKVDKILKQHQMYKDAGPLWTGQLADKKLAEKIVRNNKQPELSLLLQNISDESKLKAWPFYDIHTLCKKNKLSIPKKELIVREIKKKKYKVSNTHFSLHSVRSNIPKRELIEILRRLQPN
ncbi:hypothetical protein DRJ17_01515 [Candidatus Woesearchaeota archaeon]|nr:MAG: hypothetical protein DRJ17_01515 [Candidatus Woesearchaeota archaeon]